MPFFVYSFAAVGLLFAFVAFQRHSAKVWTANAGRPATSGAARTHFRRVWLQTTPPRHSMFAFRDRHTGSLSIDRDFNRATFRTRTGSVIELSSLTSVEMGGRGTDFVNTWIEVRGRIGSGDSVAYLNDGRWFGWRAALTRSNRILANALLVLIKPTAS